jgi:hypothetical protein
MLVTHIIAIDTPILMCWMPLVKYWYVWIRQEAKQHPGRWTVGKYVYNAIDYIDSTKLSLIYTRVENASIREPNKKHG